MAPPGLRPPPPLGAAALAPGTYDGTVVVVTGGGTGLGKSIATEFGRLAYEPGDYVLIPKSVTFSLMPDNVENHMLVVESPAPLELTEHKQTGRHMPVDPTVLVLPELCDYGFPRADEYELRVKHGGAHSSIFYRNNPLVSVGWKGDLFPYKLNIRDIIPISSDRIHIALELPAEPAVGDEQPGGMSSGGERGQRHQQGGDGHRQPRLAPR